MATNRQKELKKKEHQNAMRFWLMAANPHDYDLASAFNYHKTIDWRRSRNFENGDILFIYVSGNVQKVRYKVEVIEELLHPDDVKYNKMFWKNEQRFEQSKKWKWMRFQLIAQVDTIELSLTNLRDNGLKGNIQGPTKITGKFLDYIMSFFEYGKTHNNNNNNNNMENLTGIKQELTIVNKYECDPVLRKQCINYYGIQCQVCGLSFEETYGRVGKDFIHIHHIESFLETQQDYAIDPTKNLVPVCLNCHAMLHRKEKGVYLTIEQLRERMKRI